MKKFEEVMKVSNEIENISIDDAKKKLNDPNVQFIDVRDKESFEKGTIGNAMHLDRGLLEFYLAEGSPLENDFFKKNPDKEYVLFCGGRPPAIKIRGYLSFTFLAILPAYLFKISNLSSRLFCLSLIFRVANVLVTITSAPAFTKSSCTLSTKE